MHIKNPAVAIIVGVSMCAVIGISVYHRMKQDTTVPPTEIQTEQQAATSQFFPEKETNPSTEEKTVQAVTLEITAPSENAIVTSPSLAVKGKTIPLADVFINDKETKANANGEFSVTLTLDEGENTIIVDVFDENGNTNENEFTVSYQSAK